MGCIIAVAITMTTEPEQIMQKGNAKVLDEIMLSDYDKTNTQRRSHTNYVCICVVVSICTHAYACMYVQRSRTVFPADYIKDFCQFLLLVMF